MAKEQKQAVQPEAPKETPAEQTPEQLMSELQAAISKGDFKLVTQISRKIDTLQKATEKAELEAKRAVLDKVAERVKAVYVKYIQPLIDKGELDAADGIWITHDFGEGDTPVATVRLLKTTTRAPRTGGGGTGKKFDVSTDDLLAKYGNEAYKETGMTFKAAYGSNTDKNWRYAIRTALLKKDGII